MDYSMAGAGFQLLSSAVQGYNAASITRTQTKTSNAIRDANNRTIAAVNEKNAAGTALARWRQSVYNSRVLDKVESDQYSSEVNFQRQMDIRAKAGFSANVKAAEESGRQQAAAAFSGVTGSVVDVIDGTSRLRNDIQRQQFETTNGQLAYDHGVQQAAQGRADLDQMDFSVILDNIATSDYGKTIQPYTNPLPGLQVGSIIELGKGLANFKWDSAPSADPFASFYQGGTTSTDDR